MTGVMTVEGGMEGCELPGRRFSVEREGSQRGLETSPGY